MTAEEREGLIELDYRLRIVLPEEYQDSYDDIQPVAMRSAALKLDSSGAVAWNDMWATFCDLAMAGGPPHKGALLESGRPDDIATHAADYARVTAEICRGIQMVTGLDAEISPTPGWVRVTCHSSAMAAWLLRAIVMENVAVRAAGRLLDLPAAPSFRLDREIKNVITVMAKTCHYWVGHLPLVQRRAVAHFFSTLEAATPLIEASRIDDRAPIGVLDAVADAMAERIAAETGLSRTGQRYFGWLGLACPSVRSAIWMMRGLVVHNILSRREGHTLFVPLNPLTDPGGIRVAKTLVQIHGLAAAAAVR